MLHLIFQANVNSAVFERMGVGDTAIFLESGVLGVMKNSRIAEFISAKLSSNRFCVLSDDMQVRGILQTEVAPGVETIDYAGLVKLTVENPQIATWC